MKRFSFLLILCCITLLLAGCDKSTPTNSFPSSTKELYTAGMELVATMEDMIQSDDYAELLGTPDSLLHFAQKVNTGDYHTPTAVYRITLPKTEKLLTLTNGETSALWAKLPENLKEQVENRMSFSMLVSLLNGQQGSDVLAFSSMYTATDTDSRVRVTENTTLLYIFEKGTSIAVTFTEQGTMQGQFIFLPKTDSFEEVQAAFAQLGCTVTEVNF